MHPRDEPHPKNLEEFEQFLTTKNDLTFLAKLASPLPTSIYIHYSALPSEEIVLVTSPLLT